MNFFKALIDFFVTPVQAALKSEYNHDAVKSHGKCLSHLDEDEKIVLTTQVEAWKFPTSASVEAAKALEVPAVPVVSETPLTPIQKIRKSFNAHVDLLVISNLYLNSPKISQEDRDWVVKLGNSVIYFDDNSLVNIAVIHAGSTYYR